MLPLTTTRTGVDVFRTSCEPYQKPRTIRMIKRMAMAVWMYSFFQSFLRVAVNVLPSVGEVGCSDLSAAF